MRSLADTYAEQVQTSKGSLLVIDSGLGNVRSVSHAFRRIGEEAHLECDAPPQDTIDRYALVVLPGVGSFDRGVDNLRERGWTEWLGACRQNHTPILGLCLGMQLLCEGSAEGAQVGLGFIPGKFEKFTSARQGNRRLKVPHMGWNYVRFDHSRAPWSGEPHQPKRFYFVHSYFLPSHESGFAVGWTEYGETFTSAIAKDRVIGLQFHPEKSHRFGTDLLRGIEDWARA